MSGVLKTVLSPITAVVGAITGAGKTPTLPVAQPIATRDDAAAAAAANDSVRRRKGQASNMLFGDTGTEAPAGSTAVKMLTGS